MAALNINSKGAVTALTTTFSSAEQMMRFKNTIILAAGTESTGITGADSNEV